MRVTITNETANDVVLITLPSGGGQAIQSGGATTIEVDSGSQITFDQITVQDYAENGGRMKDPNAIDADQSTGQTTATDIANLMNGLRLRNRE